MKHIKLFEAFNSEPTYKKPEYEFKEFYRAFKNYRELREILPQNIDHGIFNVKGTGFDNEPEWIDTHCDPPGKKDSITTESLIEIAKEEDPRFIPLILWCKEAFDSGKMKKIALEFLSQNLDLFKNQDWDPSALRNQDFISSCQREWEKAQAAGIVNLNVKGLQPKYPEIKIGKAQWWALYAKDSIGYFDSLTQSGGSLPCTQFILHNGIYYTIGGRRRMYWHAYHGIDPTVWIIDI